MKKTNFLFTLFLCLTLLVSFASAETAAYVPDETIEADGSYALTVTMTQNAVSLIELIPVK